MAPYVDIFSGGPNGSLGKTIADAYQASQNRMAPQNALLQGAGTTPAVGKGASSSDMTRTLLRSAISHAALLSDTPEKWAATVAMLKQNGIDPVGYEDFEKGRPRAMRGPVSTAPDAAL